MPLPRNLQTLLLTGIFGILLLFALYFTGEVVLPIIFAFILYLVLQPLMRGAARLRIPKPLAALIVILVIFGGVGALGFTLSGPAADWISKAPGSLRRIEDRLFLLKQPIANLQSVTKQVEKITEGSAPATRAVTVAGPGVSSLLLSGTRTMLVGLGTTVVLLFFLLVSGDLFLRRVVEILPTLSNKKQAVEISREIESNISGYLATISAMNLWSASRPDSACYLCGLSDPILWGTVAFLLNFVPILGPLCGVVLLLLAGLLTFDTIWQAVMPAGIYLRHPYRRRREVVTPMLLARRFIAQSGAGHRLAGLLVLDVGRRRRASRGAHARHLQDRLRPRQAADGAGPFPGCGSQELTPRHHWPNLRPRYCFTPFMATERTP